MSAPVWPGRAFPLGAMWDGNGTNFSLFSENAERVQLCLFDGDDHETCVELTERTLVLRPHNEDYPITLIPLEEGRSVAEYIVGRVCHVAVES